MSNAFDAFPCGCAITAVHLFESGSTGAQWDVESKIIKRMQQKLAFKRNPRYDYMLPAPHKAASVSPAGKGSPHRAAIPGLTCLQRSRSATVKANTCFVCEPEVVRFSEWEPGKSYDLRLQVCTPACAHSQNLLRTSATLTTINKQIYANASCIGWAL
jgi:hypothetical protein